MYGDKYNNTIFRRIITHVADCIFKGSLYNGPNDRINVFLQSGNTVEKLVYSMEQWFQLFEQGLIYYTWLIKFSGVVDYEGDGYLHKYKKSTYERAGWRNHKYIDDMLGGKFFRENTPKSNVITDGELIILHEFQKPLQIIENSGLAATKEPDKIEDEKRLFLNRYFANKDFLSMRNMGHEPVVTKKLYNVQLNQIIGDQNIFDKDLVRCGKFFADMSSQREDKIKRKVLTYIYECLYFYNGEDEAYTVFSDMEKVLLIEDISSRFEVKLKKNKDGYYICENLKELEKGIDKLLEIARKLILHGPWGDNLRYQETLFYNTILLPFYEDLLSVGYKC